MTRNLGIMSSHYMCRRSVRQLLELRKALLLHVAQLSVNFVWIESAKLIPSQEGY